MSKFIQLLGAHRWNYFVLMICSAIISGSEATLHPLLLKAVFDEMSRKENYEHFLYVATAYFVLGLAINILAFFLSLWQSTLNNKIVSQVSEKLLSDFFTKKYDEILKEGEGYYVARIRSDVKDGLAPMLVDVCAFFTSFTTFISLIAILIFISREAFILLILVIPFSTLFSIIVARKIKQITNVERDKEAQLINILSKSISSYKTVRNFSLLPKTLHLFSTKLNEVLKASFEKYKSVKILRSASDIIMVVSDSCSIFVGAYLVFQSKLTLGSFVAFMNAFWRSTTTLFSLFNQWAVLQGQIVIINRLASFSDVDTTASAQKESEIIIAKNINYSYGDKLIVSNFSVEIKPGEWVLILGKNGSGKTTLANILCNQLKSYQGYLQLPTRISGMTLPVNFPPIKTNELPIDANLLSIFDLSRPEILNELPENLSVGQKQKIALALALSKEADLYILDEPFANLDANSCIIAMEEIERRVHGQSLIMIMHNADDYLQHFNTVHTLTKYE